MYWTPNIAIEYNSTANKTLVSEQDVVISCDMNDWTGRTIFDPASDLSENYFIAFGVGWSGYEPVSITTANSSIIDDPVVISEQVLTNKICVKLPLPAYNPTTDLGKVLQITSDGLAWVSLT